MLGELTVEEIEEVLNAEVIGRVGCIAEGWPYIVPVTYAYDGTSVYAHTAEGLKLQAMRENPNVCFEVEQVRSMKNWRTVIARGRFEQLWRDDEERAMDLLTARFASSSTSTTTQLERREDVHRREGVKRPVLFRVRLVSRTGRFELA
jgi:nitroimidazol reductase NimA-like FMN-containing flavoprotein (pyridoxamine 5'-phosphate oxidase superfamily)